MVYRSDLALFAIVFAMAIASVYVFGCTYPDPAVGYLLFARKGTVVADSLDHMCMGCPVEY